MPYISNPVFLGVGASDAADASALARNAKFADTFTRVSAALRQMTPTQRQKVLNDVRTLLNAMPYDEMEAHVQTALQAARTIAPNRAPGLGQAGAIGTVAKVAGIIASLTTTGLAVVNFIDTRKTNKANQAMAEEQAALVKQQMQAQIDAQKQQNEAQQKMSDIQTQKAQLDAAGMTLDAQGNVVKKSSVPTIAAIAAAGAGAFLLAR